MTATKESTTIRVSTETRERINDLADGTEFEGEFLGRSTDEIVRHLLDFHWKTRAIEAMDRYRREHPDEWRAYLEQAERWTQTELADVDLDATEGPYFASREDYQAALADHDRQKDVA